MNENLNEIMETEGMDNIYLEPTDEEESKSSSGLKVVLGLAAGAAALGGVAYKAIKSKKTDKPAKKKRKFHIGWVDVDNDIEEVIDDVDVVNNDEIDE